jgi:hypothetical protein
VPSGTGRGESVPDEFRPRWVWVAVVPAMAAGVCYCLGLDCAHSADCDCDSDCTANCDRSSDFDVSCDRDCGYTADCDRDSDFDVDCGRDCGCTADCDRNCGCTADCDHGSDSNADRNRDRTSTATRASAATRSPQPPQHSTADRNRHSTAPHLVLPSLGEGSPHRPPSPPSRASVARRARDKLSLAFVRFSHEDAGRSVKAHATVVTRPVRRQPGTRTGRDLVATDTEQCWSASGSLLAGRSPAVGEVWGPLRLPGSQPARQQAG